LAILREALHEREFLTGSSFAKLEDVRLIPSGQNLYYLNQANNETQKSDAPGRMAGE
jgi:hypothetical protein